MKIIVKGLVYFTFFMLLTNLWISKALATEIKIPAMKTMPGQLVHIPIIIDEVDNLAGVKLVMNYDSKILHFKDGAKTKQTNSLMHIINSKKPGTLIVVMAGARGIKIKELPILILTFEVGEGLEKDQTTRLSITEAQLMSDKLKDIKYTITIDPISISRDAVPASPKNE